MRCGATVCLRGTEPCTTTDAEGAYGLSAPAHEEIAITAIAPGYAGRVVALATVGRDVNDWGLTLVRDATMKARYTAFGATYPDAAMGFLFVTAQAPAAHRSWRVSRLA